MGSLRYIVEKEKVAHNIGLLRQRVGNGRLYVVLKANGYGLGCREIAALCGQFGVDHFAVTDLRDAEAVVASGIKVAELLLLSSAMPADIPRLVQLGVTFTVASEQDAENLAGLAVAAHVKVDTGMGRRGFYYHDPRPIAALYGQYPNIRFTGIYTHFADGADRKKTETQFSRFQTVLNYLQGAGISVGVRHCCASSSVFGYDSMLLDGVRVGSALLGRVFSGERYGLQRTGLCYAPIEAVRVLPKGATVGYGQAFRTTCQTVTAICPVGTHHGFGVVTESGKQNFRDWMMLQLRRLRNRITGRGELCAVVSEKNCPVLGCVCSEMVVLDVTNVPCQPGDMARFSINPMLLHDVPVVFK